MTRNIIYQYKEIKKDDFDYLYIAFDRIVCIYKTCILKCVLVYKINIIYNSLMTENLQHRPMFVMK